MTTTLEFGVLLDAALSLRPTRLSLLRQLDRAGSEIEQAILLLAESGVPDVAALPVGLIDRLLLHLHRRMLGEDLECVVACPACGGLNALPLGPDDVPEYAPRSAWCGRGAGLREPTGADLLDLPEVPVGAGEVVLARCAIGPADGPRELAALDRVEQSLCGMVRASCTECAATIECRTIERSKVGDHVLFLGEVEHCSYHRVAPLLFCQGSFLEGVSLDLIPN